MAVNDDALFNPPRLHPIHGILLGATIPLFLGALLSDLAYASSYQIQWSNFSSWLIAGGLVFGGAAALWAIATHIFSRRHNYLALYVALLVMTWILGFFNSLIHAKDAWATMPMGLILSAAVVLLACVSTWIGFVKFGVGGRR